MERRPSTMANLIAEPAGRRCKVRISHHKFHSQGDALPPERRKAVELLWAFAEQPCGASYAQAKEPGTVCAQTVTVLKGPRAEFVFHKWRITIMLTFSNFFNAISTA